MEGMVVPWMAEVVLISWRTVRKDGRPPLPSELLATFVAFGTFSVVAHSQPRIAAALGWGIVIATGLNLFPEAIAPKSGSKQTATPSQPGKPSAGAKPPVTASVPVPGHGTLSSYTGGNFA